MGEDSPLYRLAFLLAIVVGLVLGLIIPVGASLPA